MQKIKLYDISKAPRAIVETWHAASLLLLLSALSCTQQDTLLQESPQAVRFTTEIVDNAATRATESQWTAGDAIGIRMTDVSGNIVDGYANVPYIADVNGNFTPAEGDMYYPNSGVQVGFTAYYPYNATLQNGRFAVNLANQSNPEAIDLLHATTTAQYGKFSTGGVTLPFRHMMSKLVLKTQAGAGFTAADLTGMQVAIKRLNSHAIFNTATGELTDAVAAGIIIPHTVSDGAHYEAIVAPTVLAVVGQTMQVAFTVGGKEYVWDAPQMAFVSGQAHEWMVTISRTGITVAEGNIAPWVISTVIDDDTRTVYKIGDCYPDPANPATAIGVVFSVSNNGKSGKIVSLDEGHDLQWSSESGNFGATSDDNGQVNTNDIKTYKQNNPISIVTFPAFEWCTAKGTRWYLPAKDELLALYSQKVAVNTALAGISGAMELNNLLYWSSSASEYVSHNNLAWLISFSNGKPEYDYKLGKFNVRAVSAF